MIRSIAVHDGQRTVFTADKPHDLWEITVIYPDGDRDVMDVHPSEIPAFRSLLSQIVAQDRVACQRTGVETTIRGLFSDREVA